MPGSVVLPTVCSLEEAEEVCDYFEHVVSLVPSTSPTLSAHPKRLSLYFADVFFPHQEQAPTLAQVQTILSFAPAPLDSLLVHCRAGVSRSTAVSLGLLASWGLDPTYAYDQLLEAHPPGRLFAPNPLVLALFDQALNLNGSLYEPGIRWLQ